MASWHTDLPAHLINTFTETVPDNLIRSDMDKGPAKVRRRTTANVRAVAFTIACTPEQLAILDEFYTDTLASGADQFDYTHPRTGDAVQARFTQPPTYTDLNGRAYKAQIALEILP